MRLAQFPDVVVNLRCLRRTCRQPPHLLESPRRQDVVMSASLDEIVINESRQHWKYGQGINLLVGLRQTGPHAVIVEREGMRERPRQTNVAERRKGETYRLRGARGECSQHLVVIASPVIARRNIKPPGMQGGGPATKYRKPSVQ